MIRLFNEINDPKNMYKMNVGRKSNHAKYLIKRQFELYNLVVCSQNKV